MYTWIDCLCTCDLQKHFYVGVWLPRGTPRNLLVMMCVLSMHLRVLLFVLTYRIGLICVLLKVLSCIVKVSVSACNAWIPDAAFNFKFNFYYLLFSLCDCSYLKYLKLLLHWRPRYFTRNKCDVVVCILPSTHL